MNLELYGKFVGVTKILATTSAPSGVFQEYIEKKLNSMRCDEFFSPDTTITNNSNNCDTKSKFYIRLKSPENRNSKDRGLKVCLFDDNIFEEKTVGAGTTLFKFNPMIRVVGLTNDNCAECGKFLINIGENSDQQKGNLTDFAEGYVHSKCSDCDFRVFCSSECKIRAVLDWHDIECQFIEHVRKELVVVNCDNNGKKQGWVKKDLELDEAVEKTILLIITVFRLLINMAKGDENILGIVSNMSDHMSLFKTFIQTGKTDCLEHKLLFNDTKNTFAPLIMTFFEKSKRKLLFDNSALVMEDFASINENGIYRACLLVFVNVSSAMDYFNNSLGLMFDPVFSMINHSCEPNCTLIWKDNGLILVKSLKELTASNEIYLNYIPVYMPREMRQKQLKSSFFFDCECYGCVVSDRKFDSMLPISCYYCGHVNDGFLLENFAVNDNLPKVSQKLLCSNCDIIIDAKDMFFKYLKIFRFYKGLNPDIEDIEDLCNWGINSANIIHMNDIQYNKSVALLKECYDKVPLNSWPMSLLMNMVKTGLHKREPMSLNVLRLTYLSSFIIDNMMEKRCNFKNTIGASLYDLAVVSSDFLFDQYLLSRENIEREIRETIGWGCFSLCILSYKHLRLRSAETTEAESKDSSEYATMERSQKDMVSLAAEILRLLKHWSNKVDNDDTKLSFSQHLFENALTRFEQYLDCGSYAQMCHVVLQLCDADYTVFGVVPCTQEPPSVVLLPPVSQVRKPRFGKFFGGSAWVELL